MRVAAGHTNSNQQGSKLAVFGFYQAKPEASRGDTGAGEARCNGVPSRERAVHVEGHDWRGAR
jgi:hypothetical protein